MPIPPAPARVKTNALTIQEKTCSCGRWQEYKYPCRHAMAELQEMGRYMPFLDILQPTCALTFYRNKKHATNRYMDTKHFPWLYKIISDMMGETKSKQHWGTLTNLDDDQKTKIDSTKHSHFLNPEHKSPIQWHSLVEKGGHNQSNMPKCCGRI